MDEELSCGCKNKGCHFCGDNDEIWATLKNEDADGGECCLHICGECHHTIISENLTKEAKEEFNWIEEE